VDLAKDAGNQLDREGDKQRCWYMQKKRRSILKTIWIRKRKQLGRVLRQENFLHDILEGKMRGGATRYEKDRVIA